MSFQDSTKVVNTAACWEHHGAFTVTLSHACILELPVLRGAFKVGDQLHVYQGVVKKPHRPEASVFRITVNDDFSFSLPAEAVVRIEDGDRRVICQLIPS